MVDTIFAQMGDLKVGKYVMIEGLPCRVVSMDKSKPGKHGAAKISIVAMSLFDNTKHSLMKSSDADCEVPLVERRRAQVISIDGTSANLMDLETFETFEVTVPEEMREAIEAGKETQYMQVMGRKLLLQVYEKE
ncbi:translation initiation factor IF-5A [Candidatus Micrarchaeota archaeon]|nr:translation initiation factor IF-5A [Candidatus Micrarchaeota archaeon]MBI5177287.1 translation initiation factor IF-5A [Candidatus Micrarchaeota archaeon]